MFAITFETILICLKHSSGHAIYEIEENQLIIINPANPDEIEVNQLIIINPTLVCSKQCCILKDIEA